MPLVTLVFPFRINVSVQIRDVVYFVQTNPVGIDGIPIANTTTPSGVPWESTTTPHWTGDRNAVVEIGFITNIIPWNGTDERIVADMPQNLIDQYGLPSGFIMFSKDNKANLSSLLGYYALAKFRNNSKDKAELFSVGAEFDESSK